MSLTDMLIGVATLAGIGTFSYGCNMLLGNHYILSKKESQNKYNLEEKEMSDDYSFFNEFGGDKK